MRRIFASIVLLAAIVPLFSRADAQEAAAADYKLRKGSETEKVAAAQNLAAIGSEEAIGFLCEGLMNEADLDLCGQFGEAIESLKNEAGFKVIATRLPKWTEGRGLYASFWALHGVAKSRQPAGDALLKAALGANSVYTRAAACEALGEAARLDAAPWVADTLKNIKKDPPSKEILGVLCALCAAPKLIDFAAADKAPRNELMAGALNVLAVTANDRVRYFASHTLAALSGEKPYLDLEFWRAWLKNNGAGDAPRPEEKRTAPKFFEAEAAGRKIVFCIDISGSMNFKLKMDAKGGGPVTRGEKGKDVPDYGGVSTRLDLAKVELLWTLAHLPDDYSFNIVTYSKGHQLIEKDTSGFVRATRDNKAKFSNLVRSLKAEGGTNIHGGLLDSLRVIDKGMCEGDPGVDAKSLLAGADTIFFLTDGHPSWSDDSEGKPTTISGNPPQAYGTGKMAQAENILKWAKLSNRFRKVVINTVGIGDHAKELLQNLAMLSFGVYIDRTGVE